MSISTEVMIAIVFGVPSLVVAIASAVFAYISQFLISQQYILTAPITSSATSMIPEPADRGRPRISTLLGGTTGLDGPSGSFVCPAY
ncbi:hypothetical protein CGCS363_v000329 [Colletotrichum siamense]|uniref:uncharacterized protein n=1 Tax=Colletotrichum siamense TaxID=690259 RepID=UPI0018723DA1|nr:uncharacterized protein CGCS363_v000329 [Colletotrichum siamense]KAF5516141.1 hypothetical protein CGCS363_v000329 [Colletotrichum siamense]